MAKKLMYFLFYCVTFLVLIVLNVLYKRDVISGGLALLLNTMNMIAFYAGNRVWERRCR